MADNSRINSRRKQTEDFMSMKELLALCLARWMWFVLALLITMSVGVYKLLSTPSVYTRTISVLVKDGRNGSDSNQQLEELGIDMTSSNITDEIVAIHSPSVILEMVRRLHLDVSYFKPGLLKDQPLYAESLPVEVRMPELEDKDNVSFMMHLDGKGKVSISHIKQNNQEKAETFVLSLGKPVKTLLGEMTVDSTLYYKKGVSADIKVVRSGINSTANRFNGAIKAKLQAKNSNIIDIECRDVSIARAENILNTIVIIYSETWIKNRNQISVSTNEFIKERLEVIEQELGNVDDDISSFKSSHSMPDVNAVASQAMAQASESSRQGAELSNQLYMARYIRNYVTSNQHANQLLPANSGINNPYIEQQIAEYNNTQLQRNNLIANSSEQNPLVMDLDRSLNTMRDAIVNSLDNELTTLNTQQRSVQATHGQAMSRMSANPAYAKYLLSVERQQKVKESLYLFLLQKREENELSQAFTAYNTRVIAPPHGNDFPTEPVKSNILLISFVLGLLIPGAIIFIIESTNTTIRGRKDLENLNVPFLGEIPQWSRRQRWWKRRKLMDKKEVREVVKPKSRNIINEAFRIARTNLEFIAGSINGERTGGKVVQITSFNPGSGKTFLCENLGASLCIGGRKVLCIDLDMRRASLSKYADDVEHGTSDYLSNIIDDYNTLIVHKEDTGLDILPVGLIPPNPTELLLSPRLKNMLGDLRQKYDYIFLDCPPVDLVADTNIVRAEADMTVFVVRSTLMQKGMLPELERMYQDKTLNNLSVLLNGTQISSHGYNRYGYGYGRSGYGYGYGGYSSKKD